jgi:hypothetical protein
MAAAELQGFRGKLPPMTVGAPKALGDGHSMGEAGLKAASEAIHYVLGGLSVGIPTLRRVDDELGELASDFVLSRDPVQGSEDAGAIVPTQGFGGYNGSIALRSANPATLARYRTEPGVLEAYLERWRELRRSRIEREARWRRSPASSRRLAEEHRWPSRG